MEESGKMMQSSSLSKNAAFEPEKKQRIKLDTSFGFAEIISVAHLQPSSLVPGRCRSGVH